MAYIGNPPAERYSSVSYQDLTGGTGTSFTLDYAVGSANEIEVFVNNVRQEPSVAYTVAGTALTMTGTIASTDDFYVVFQGKAQQTVTHPATHALEATDGTFTGDLTVDTSTLHVDSASNLVGIGTASPSGSKLDIFTGSTSTDGLKINRYGSGVYYSTLRQDSHGLAVHVGDGSSISERAAITPNGITFNGDTAAANALDDYEEGTWTGTYGGTTTDPTTAVTNTGTYTKIGNVVYVQITFNDINTTGASGAIQVRGLPYTAIGTNFATGDVMFNLGTDVSSSYVNVCVYVPASSTQAVFYATIPNSGWAPVGHNAGTGRYTWFTATYLTA